MNLTNIRIKIKSSRMFNQISEAYQLTLEANQ